MHYLRLIEADKHAKRTMMKNPWQLEVLPENDTKHILKRMRKTKKGCSKACCGNPRKHFGIKTIKERIAENQYKEEMRELKCK